MKYIAILISGYVLYMVSLPCADEIVHHNIFRLEQSSPQGKPCADNDLDGCSPFCVCACCGVIVDPVVDQIAFQPYYFIQSEYFILNTDFTSDYFNFFWQPPKIA